MQKQYQRPYYQQLHIRIGCVTLLYNNGESIYWSFTINFLILYIYIQISYLYNLDGTFTFI
jgi:hypothetical protein